MQVVRARSRRLDRQTSGRVVPAAGVAAVLASTLGLFLGVASAATPTVTFGPAIAYPTFGAPDSAAIGDLDGDGNADVVTVDTGISVAVLLGNGDGTLAPPTQYLVGHTPTAVAIGDVDGDTHPDLVTTNWGPLDPDFQSFSVSVLLGHGDGTFAPQVEYLTGGFPYRVAIGDLDGDSHPDLVVGSNSGLYCPSCGAVSVHLGVGDGTFAPPTTYDMDVAVRSVAVRDLDGDAQLDVATVNFAIGSSSVSVLLGNGDGTLAPRTDFPVSSFATSMAVGDVNEDVVPDIAVSYSQFDQGPAGVTVLLGTGDGTFTDSGHLNPTGSGPLSLAIDDLNGDDHLDLATANRVGDTTLRSVSVLLGNGDGTFDARTDLPGTALSSVALGDLDGDDRSDIAVTGLVPSGRVHVLLNTTAPVAPGAPAIIRNATAGNGQATVSWTAPGSNGGSPVTGYIVTPYVGYFPLPSTTFASTATTQTITGLTNGTTYRFRVRAVNAVGISGYSTVTNPVTPATVPGAPTIGVAVPGDGEATVSWTAPASDGGSPVSGYVVTPYIGYFPLAPRSFSSTATTQVVTGLTNGTSYRFRVQAVNAVGTGGYSTATNQVTPQPPSVIAAGGYHSCTVVAGGGVVCWGSNAAGQLGDGTTTDSPVPVPVVGLTGVIALSAGDNHTCALVAEGTVRCWGRNAYGQLGNGSTSDSSVPVPVSGLTGVTAIAAGGDVFSAHTCAVTTAGAVYCWGDDYYGQLGNGSAGASPLPAPVTGLTGATDVTAGNDHVCAVVSTGAVSCWGDNSYGELGNGTTVRSPVPVPVAGLTGATAVTAGNGHSCALVAGGAVRCWGYNFLGQLGNGTTTSSSVPVPVAGLAGATTIAGGNYNTCALVASSGAVSCWGNNADGQLGTGTATRSLVPVPVAGLSGARAIAPARGYPSDHTCARVSGGAVRCWGSNTFGQLGDGTTTSSSTPVAVIGL